MRRGCSPPPYLFNADHCCFCSLSPFSCSRNWEKKRPHRLGTREFRLEKREHGLGGGGGGGGSRYGSHLGTTPGEIPIQILDEDVPSRTRPSNSNDIGPNYTIFRTTIRFPFSPSPPPHELVRKGEREPREVLSLAPTHFFPSPLRISSVVPQLEQTIYFKAVYPRAFSSKRGKFSHVTISTIYRLIFLSSHACCWHNRRACC